MSVFFFSSLLRSSPWLWCELAVALVVTPTLWLLVCNLTLYLGFEVGINSHVIVNFGLIKISVPCRFPMGSCLGIGSSTIIPSKFLSATFNVWKITECYYFFGGGAHNTITLFHDAVNIQLWLSNVQCGDYFSRATIRSMLLQFSKAFLWNKFTSLALVSNPMRNCDRESPLLL